MLYAYIEDGRVKEIIKSEGIFENIPIEERFSPEFIENCVICDENTVEGMDYNFETGEFIEYVDVVEENEIMEELEEDEMLDILDENPEMVQVEEEETDGSEK